MATRKSAKKLTYVLSPEASASGHSLGVNALAVDAGGGCLYTGGRDGIVHVWSLKDMSLGGNGFGLSADLYTKNRAQGFTTPGNRVSLHTNWVNDLILARSGSVVTGSSDLSVKLWNPQLNTQAHIGQHLDYVKCLASPNRESDWIVSGGLDRKIIGWDLNENRGEKFSIEVKVDEGSSVDPEKASVYALAMNQTENGSAASVIAAGGPDSVVRLFDPRAPASPTIKFVGHTDNIRSLLVSASGEWVLSGSSDSTIKLWSVKASRLAQTFDMHSDSVWSLFSYDPELTCFYSGDRSGLVLKTDLTRAGPKLDLDQDAVLSVAVANEHIGVSKVVPSGDYIWTATANSWVHRWLDFDTTKYSDKLVEGSGDTGEEEKQEEDKQAGKDKDEKDDSVAVPFVNILGSPLVSLVPRATTVPEDKIVVQPRRKNPVETLEGHIGVIKHRLLTDRRSVLTLDTAGEIKLWDLLQCVPLKSFGTGLDMDNLADELNMFDTAAVVSNWCQVSTRTGELYITMESSTAFDAEIYADEHDDFFKEHNIGPFKEDHRINLGRWLISNLLAGLIEAERTRDYQYRLDKKRQYHIQQNPDSSGASVSALSEGSNLSDQDGTPTAEVINSQPNPVADATVAQTAAQASNPANGKTQQKKGLMGKLGFGKKKDGKKDEAKTGNGPGAVNGTTPPPPPVKPPVRPEMTMAEVIKEMRSHYEGKKMTTYSVLSPPGADDAPVIALPASVKIIISEQTPGSGGLVDLYRGEVGTVAQDTDLLETIAPEWIARLVLKNETPAKDSLKVGFCLRPFEGVDAPRLTGNLEQLRLTAYHMLRARKVMDYLVERLELAGVSRKTSGLPEEWLELVCQGKVITATMTLSTIRTKIWRSGGDVVLKYRLK